MNVGSCLLIGNISKLVENFKENEMDIKKTYELLELAEAELVWQKQNEDCEPFTQILHCLATIHLAIYTHKTQQQLWYNHETRHE